MSDLNYKKDMSIDEDALDVEWLEQPNLYLKYSRELAKAEREVDRLSEEISVLKAELDLEIRQSPESFDLEKVTEAAISNTIITQGEYKELQQELIEARYEAKTLKGAIESAQHKKYALQDLVELYRGNYFAGPKVPRDLGLEAKKRKEQRKKSNSSIKLNRSKNK